MVGSRPRSRQCQGATQVSAAAAYPPIDNTDPLLISPVEIPTPNFGMSHTPAHHAPKHLEPPGVGCVFYTPNLDYNF